MEVYSFYTNTLKRTIDLREDINTINDEATKHIENQFLSSLRDVDKIHTAFVININLFFSNHYSPGFVFLHACIKQGFTV